MGVQAEIERRTNIGFVAKIPYSPILGSITLANGARRIGIVANDKFKISKRLRQHELRRRSEGRGAIVTSSAKLTVVAMILIFIFGRKTL